MLDDFLTQQQADEFSYHGFYDPYDVDCDDGTMGDVIYIMHKEEPVCQDIMILTAAPSTCGVR